MGGQYSCGAIKRTQERYANQIVLSGSDVAERWPNDSEITIHGRNWVFLLWKEQLVIIENNSCNM